MYVSPEKYLHFTVLSVTNGGVYLDNTGLLYTAHKFNFFFISRFVFIYFANGKHDMVEITNFN